MAHAALLLCCLCQIYYAQGSYPLTDAARCDPNDTKPCLFAINSTTGALISSKPMENFVVYRFDHAARADGTVLAVYSQSCLELSSLAHALNDERSRRLARQWGHHHLCRDSNGTETHDSFGFAPVDLSTAKGPGQALIELAVACDIMWLA